MFIQSIEFGCQPGPTEVVNFTILDNNDDDASDMIYEFVIDYWKSNEWQTKGIILPTRTDIITLIMNDTDIDDEDYYLSIIDTMFIDYNTLFDDRWFRFV